MGKREITNGFAGVLIVSGLAALIAFIALPAKMPYANILLYGGLAGTFVGLACVAWLLTMPDRATSNLAPDSINVQMRDNHGHIGNVINEAPKPTLSMGESSIVSNADGSHTLSCMMEVVSPYPPAELKLIAKADGIRSLDIRPQRAGMMEQGHTGERDGFCFTSIYRPHGRYLVQVNSRTVPIGFEVEFL